MRPDDDGYADPSYSPDGRSIVVELTGDAKFTKLQVIRLRDLSWGATLGGRKMGQTPDASSPVWLRPLAPTRRRPGQPGRDLT